MLFDYVKYCYTSALKHILTCCCKKTNLNWQAATMRISETTASKKAMGLLLFQEKNNSQKP